MNPVVKKQGDWCDRESRGAVTQGGRASQRTWHLSCTITDEEKPARQGHRKEHSRRKGPRAGRGEG